MKTIVPCGHKVLVKPDSLEEEHKVEGTNKALVIVRHNERAQQAAQIEGTIVGIGPTAWEAFRTVDDEGKWVNGKPWATIGDKVLYGKYTGTIVDPVGDDKMEDFLVLINDEDINAVVIENER